MSITEELRRLLDEREVEHYDGTEMTLWGQPHDKDGKLIKGVYHYRAEEMGDRLFLQMHMVTPEQAIEATLERGTTKLREYDGSISVEDKPIWMCSCGAHMAEYTCVTKYYKPRYCPNCGRKVVGA